VASTISFNDASEAPRSRRSKVGSSGLVKGRVVSVAEKDVVIDIGFKSDGIISKAEFDRELEPGEEVEVRPLAEIVGTLDRRNRNRGMAFDKEMAPFCGQRHRVFQRVERIIDEASGRMLELPNDCIMLEGVVCRSRYSERRLACPRAIYSYWRECWLRRVDSSPS